MVSRILKVQILNCPFVIVFVTIFFVLIKSYIFWHFLIYFDSEIKIYLDQIKTNNSIENKSGFIDSGLVKTCDEHIISWENGYLFISSSARILIIFYTFLISLSDEL